MSAEAAGQTMFSGLCTAVRPLTDPSGAQGSLRGPKRVTIIAAGGCFVRWSGRNRGIKTEIPGQSCSVEQLTVRSCQGLTISCDIVDAVVVSCR